ncbi:protein PHOX1-like [Apium graveolens]|uniref:protein PHOX1-like n=1 Tax=Apium graveolens TaxID=4045 RepID=UPI003D797DE6
MVKKFGKKKKHAGDLSGNSRNKQNKVGESVNNTYDKDTAVFISMSEELKDEGNKCFQSRDYESAMLKYEKALKLLPRNHINVSYLRSNLAACYMQLGLSEYPRAIHECNLALEVTPKYSKALLKRARCYEAMNRLELALRDISTVLKMEPNNLMAIEIADRVKRSIGIKSPKVNVPEIDTVQIPEYVESTSTVPTKKKSNKIKDKKIGDKTQDKIAMEENDEDEIKEKKAMENIEEGNPEDKLIVEENINKIMKEEPKRTLKLVFGEDIRWAQAPIDCSILKLREIIQDRFPGLKAILVKYRDQEGDLVTVTTNEELKLAESAAEQHSSLRLYIVEVNPEQDPFFGVVKRKKEGHDRPSCIDDWIVQFAQLFKNHIGVNSDAYLDLHKLGMKFYTEAMEEAITSEEAQDIFNKASDKFQEMAALALFNWGNVHMSRARKRVYLTEDSGKSVLTQVENAFDWARKEYIKAGERYQEALKIKQDFYEGVVALGQQQFELAKLSWYHAIATNVNLETWPSSDMIQLYNCAEDNMDKGMQMWEDAEGQRHNEISDANKVKALLQKLGSHVLLKDITMDEAREQAANMRSQINMLWGTMLYERSIMEYKLGLPVWQESLEAGVEKFELAGASQTDLAIMIKNHCSSGTSSEGLGFNIDEIVQAWNEMYQAKKWQTSVPSLRLEPLLRRRASEFYQVLERS